MMRKLATMVASVGWAGAALAEPTLQAQFEAGSAALANGDNAAALAAFQAIQHRPGISTRSQAVAELRAGLALDGLSRPAEASAALRDALARMPTTDKSLVGDRIDGLMALGRQEEDALQYAPARTDFGAAMALATDPMSQIRTRVALTRVTLFTDPDRAATLASEALGLAAAAPDVKAEDKGQIRTLRGRALLNAGHPAEALAELKAAVADLGGLSLKVDRADLIARSDLAIAALRAGDPTSARKYLAYTGSGLLDEELRRGAEMDPPACGELKPDDVAVVQFGIADDGHVEHPQLIYSSARGDQALLFPQAVAGWSWAPESVKSMTPLFRSVLRVEMRCLTSAARPGIGVYLQSAVARWADEAGLAPVEIDAPSSAAALPLLREELARRERSPKPSDQFTVLLALANNSVTGAAESRDWITRAITIAERLNAPPLVRATLQIRAANIHPDNDRRPPDKEIAELQRMSSDPAFVNDPKAAEALRLVLAERLGDVKRWNAALPVLEAADADTRLPRADPLRQAAAARLASMQVAAGRVEEARATFARSGESAQQCALVDATPIHTRGSAGERDYPDAAREWGFSGWTSDELDIQADGTPAHIRTVVAYPPFVFGPAVEKYLERTRYTQSFRPDGQAGCGGYRTSLAFRYLRQ